MLELVRIPTPSWSEPTTVEISPHFAGADLQAIQLIRPAVERAALDAMAAYFEQSDLQGTFPDLRRLTGNHYLSQECYYIGDEPWFPKVGRPREVVFSLLFHFTEASKHDVAIEQDYLGLAVLFKWDASLGRFAWAATDSSSI